MDVEASSASPGTAAAGFLARRLALLTAPSGKARPRHAHSNAPTWVLEGSPDEPRQKGQQQSFPITKAQLGILFICMSNMCYPVCLSDVLIIAQSLPIDGQPIIISFLKNMVSLMPQLQLRTTEKGI